MLLLLQLLLLLLVLQLLLLLLLGFSWYIIILCCVVTWSWFCWYINILQLNFLMLLQVFIDRSTLSYCVKLEVEFVDTSTFSTEFLDVASGFCWYFNILLFGKAWGGVCWYINILQWISWCCLRFLLIYQHSNLVKRAVEFVDTSTFFTAIYEIWTNIWIKWPYNLYFCWGLLLLTCD